MVSFAKVKSGHDKNHVYLLYKEDERMVYLVNGTTKTIQNPRKKNRIHIQIIKKLPEQVMEILNRQTALTNEIIKAALEEYTLYLSH